MPSTRLILEDPSFCTRTENKLRGISIEDLHLLERLIEEEEDRIDIVETEKILADVKEQGTVPWERIKAELGL